ncbi:MAG: AI-2E family transporter, partial [Clostridia bacterium]|nr:AI-2E family transporter [Clostridia bacterium]
MKSAWKPYVRAGVCVFVLFLAISYWHQAARLISLFLQAAMPLLLGCAIAYIVNILMSFYERKVPIRKAWWFKVKRPCCLALALITVILVLLLLFQLIIPQLISCFQVLIKALPNALRSLYAWLEQTFHLSTWLNEQALKLPETSADWEALLTKGASVLISGVGGVMNVAVSAVSTVVGSLVTFFLSLIFAFYLLTGKEKLGAQLRRLSEKARGFKVTECIHGVGKVV